MNTLVIVVLLAITIHGSVALLVTEGERAKLNFSYPCDHGDSTYVTLQHGHEVPFYFSNNPTLTKLSPNHLIVNNNTAGGGTYCILYFTIKPVLIADGGGYILTTYKDGYLVDDQRLWLHVDYFPGTALCESRTYIDENWVSLYCTAPVGTIPGQIICYQAGMRIPPLALPDENDDTLNQIMLARHSSDHVYCCSSALEQTKDKCECKDWGWDPINNKQNDNSNPCPTSILPSSDLTPSHDHYDNPLFNATTTTTGLPIKKNSQEGERRLLNILIIIIDFFFVVICCTCMSLIRCSETDNKGGKGGDTSNKNSSKEEKREMIPHESKGEAEAIA